MTTILNQLPPKIQDHIKNITVSSGLPDDDKSYENIASAWMEKEKSFADTISQQGLKLLDQLSMEDPRGGIALTYSGSLIFLGPVSDGYRKAAYYSIGLRKDVPNSLQNSNSKLQEDIELNRSIVFKVGPIKKTSPIYKFAVCDDLIAIADQEEKISNTTIIITNDFVDINKAIIPV